MKASGEKTVLLADLYRYIFDLDYNPPIAPGGEHDLTFVDQDGMLATRIAGRLLLIVLDAEDFMDAIHEVKERA